MLTTTSKGQKKLFSVIIIFLSTIVLSHSLHDVCNHNSVIDRLKIESSSRSYVESVINRVLASRYTMASPARLTNVMELAFKAFVYGIPGSFVETGVWKGGCSMISRAVAVTTNSTECHHSWLFDSFEGLPKPRKEDELAEATTTVRNHQHSVMDPPGSYKDGSGLEEVKKNFRDVFGNNFRHFHMVKGWFNDTVFTAPVDRIALLRLDGDLYTSTMDVLHAFYHKVSPGGFVIIDDYGWWPQCKLAVHDFFDKKLDMNITSKLHVIDETGVWFQKPTQPYPIYF